MEDVKSDGGTWARKRKIVGLSRGEGGDSIRVEEQSAESLRKNGGYSGILEEY